MTTVPCYLFRDDFFVNDYTSQVGGCYLDDQAKCRCCRLLVIQHPLRQSEANTQSQQGAAMAIF